MTKNFVRHVTISSLRLPLGEPIDAEQAPPDKKGETQMIWYHYIVCFFSGLFLANAVPHFVHGISGNRFPTPFAHPPGKGLSSPTVNVLWALGNLIAGYLLFRAGEVSSEGNAALLVFFAGIAAISIVSSVGFQRKQSS